MALRWVAVHNTAARNRRQLAGAVCDYVASCEAEAVAPPEREENLIVVKYTGRFEQRFSSRAWRRNLGHYKQFQAAALSVSLIGIDSHVWRDQD